MFLHQVASINTFNKHDESLKQTQNVQKHHFSSILEKVQQQDIMVLKNKAHDVSVVLESKSQQYQEHLQARLETIQQDQVKKESKRGLDIYQSSSRAVVGMVSQDFWRQAFSGAIQQNEQHSNIAHIAQDSFTPTLPILFEDEKS